MLILPLAILLVCNAMYSCKSDAEESLLGVRGKVQIKYTNQKAGYSWDFLRDVRWKLIKIKETELNGPGFTNIKWYDAGLFALNYKDSKLLLLDSSLASKGSFGEKGKDSVFKNDGILNYDYEKGTLSLYDFGSKAVKQFTMPSGKLIYHAAFSHPTGIYRVGHLTGKMYVYVQPKDSTDRDIEFVFFDSSDLRQERKFSLNKLLGITDKKEYPSMAYDGNFVTHSGSKYIVYYCSFGGVFFCFDKSNNSAAFSKLTIDKTPVPTARYVDISPIHKSLEISPNIMFFPDACIYDNKLYILNNINSTKEYIADVYDLADKGNYSGSFFLPNSSGGSTAASIAVAADRVYILYKDQKITSYGISN